MKKFFRRFLLVFFLCICLVYVTNITSIPNSVILFDNEAFHFNTVFGIDFNEDNLSSKATKPASASITDAKTVLQDTLTVSLFDIIDLKKVEINTIPSATVVPLGNSIGLKLYTSGVLVIGMSEINGKKPYKNSNIEEGDMIVSINNNHISSTDELIQCVNNCNGDSLNIEYVRNGTKYSTNIEPTKTSSNEYKLGLWVKDGAAGIGTITYYEPSSNKFAALGHGIVDSDTEKLISISNGDVVTASISSITKGEKDKPGELKGNIASSQNLGTISTNTEFGIYGNLTNTTLLNINADNQLEVALRNEIQTGKAKILLTLENSIRKEYDIEIVKIYRNNNYDNKSMLIKVTDEKLLELTGGIIQGMSGAPIIQNNKFIGAITHVLISDPTTGYAVFGDLMIKQSREIR